MQKPANKDLRPEDFQKAGVLLAKESLATVGINEDLLNQKAREELEADSVHFVKVKGFLQPWSKLPPGYKIIKSGAFESLIEHCGPRWDTRQKARIDLQKRLGLYPAEDINVSHGFSDLMQDVLADVMDKTKGKLPSEDDSE